MFRMILRVVIFSVYRAQGSLDNVLEESRVMVDQLQRDHRTRERGKGREVREELRSMRENGGSSFEEIDTKRKEYVAQLDELRRANEVSKEGREEEGVG